MELEFYPQKVVGKDGLPINKNISKEIIKGVAAGLGLKFNSVVKDLIAGKKYFFRAYALNKEGVGYGSVLDLKTVRNISPWWIKAQPGAAAVEYEEGRGALLLEHRRERVLQLALQRGRARAPQEQLELGDAHRVRGEVIEDLVWAEASG